MLASFSSKADTLIIHTCFDNSTLAENRQNYVLLVSLPLTLICSDYGHQQTQPPNHIPRRSFSSVSKHHKTPQEKIRSSQSTVPNGITLQRGSSS